MCNRQWRGAMLTETRCRRISRATLITKLLLCCHRLYYFQFLVYESVSCPFIITHQDNRLIPGSLLFSMISTTRQYSTSPPYDCCRYWRRPANHGQLRFCDACHASEHCAVVCAVRKSLPEQGERNGRVPQRQAEPAH